MKNNNKTKPFFLCKKISLRNAPRPKFIWNRFNLFITFYYILIFEFLIFKNKKKKRKRKIKKKKPFSLQSLSKQE